MVKMTWIARTALHTFTTISLPYGDTDLVRNMSRAGDCASQGVIEKTVPYPFAPPLDVVP
jgi:hypothetical protein